MSEPIWVSMHIGGTLTEHLDSFVDAMQEFSEGTEGGSYSSLVTNSGHYYVEGRVNWGNPEETKSFCQAHDLPYEWRCDGTYEYAPECGFWVPGKKEGVFSANSEGKPVVTMEQARKLLQQAINAIKTENKRAIEPLTRGMEQLCPKWPKIPKFKVPEDILPTLIGINLELDEAIAKRLKSQYEKV